MSTVKIKGAAATTPTATNTGEGITAIGSGGASLWHRTAEAENDYSPEKFYCKATDWQGHGERFSTKVPPNLYAEVMKIVHDDDLPDYDSPQSVVRDGLVHLLAMRTAQMGGVELRASLHAYMRELALVEWSEQVKRDSEAWSQLSENINASMETMQRDGAYRQMDVTLDRYAEFAEGIPEPYQSKSFESIAEWRKKIPKGVTPVD